MSALKVLVAALIGACSLASAQDVVLIGHVQRVILQPQGTENCPPSCPVAPKLNADGSKAVCVSNMGGCQSMEITVDRIFRGGAGEKTRNFRSSMGEWGPSFPVTEKQIVVSEEAGRVSWSLATLRDGKIYVDPKSLRMAGVSAAAASKDGLVALDELLARTGSKH
jgi:hypothetical protein